MASVFVDEVMKASGLSRPEVVLVATKLVRMQLAKGPVDALRMLAEDPDLINRLEQRIAEKQFEELQEEIQDDQSAEE